MINRIVFVVIVPFLVSYVFAKEIEEFPFIGVTITSETHDIKTPKETVSGIRWGKQTLSWRTMITYQQNATLDLFFLQIDKILMDDIMGMPELRPYIGFSLGKVETKNAPTIDQKGYFYGTSAGLIIYATDTIDADISYHYYKVKEIEGIDSIKGPAVSLHYFY